MFCKHCGKQLSDGSVFCKFCGQRLDAQPQPQPQQPQQQAWQQPQRPPQAPPPQQPPRPAYAPPPQPAPASAAPAKAGGFNSGFVMLGVSLALLVGAAVFGLSRLDIVGEGASSFATEDSVVGMWLRESDDENEDSIFEHEDSLYEFHEDGTLVHYETSPENAIAESLSKDECIDWLGTFSISDNILALHLRLYLGNGATVEHVSELEVGYEVRGDTIVIDDQVYVSYDGPLWPEDEEAPGAEPDEEAGEEPEAASSSERSVVGMWSSTGNQGKTYVFGEDGTFEYYNTAPDRAAEYGLSKEECTFGIGTYTITGNMMQIVYTRYMDGAPSEFVFEREYRLEYAQDGFENAPGIVNEEGFALSGEIFVPYEGEGWK